MQNPKFSTVLGLILEAKALEALKIEEANISAGKGELPTIETAKNNLAGNDVISKLANSLKSVFKDLF